MPGGDCGRREPGFGIKHDGMREALGLVSSALPRKREGRARGGATFGFRLPWPRNDGQQARVTNVCGERFATARRGAVPSGARIRAGFAPRARALQLGGPPPLQFRCGRRRGLPPRRGGLPSLRMRRLHSGASAALVTSYDDTSFGAISAAIDTIIPVLARR
jgi:hypothetical protein